MGSESNLGQSQSCAPREIAKTDIGVVNCPIATDEQKEAPTSQNSHCDPDPLRTPHVKSLSAEDTHCDKGKVETDDDSDDELFGNGVYDDDDDSDDDDLDEKDETRRFSESSGDDK